MDKMEKAVQISDNKYKSLLEEVNLSVQNLL